MISKEDIKKIKESNQFLTFRDFILEKIKELDSVDGLEKMNNRKAGEEAKIRFKAAKLLLDILSPFVGYGEKKEPTAEDVHEAKKGVGLT